MNKDNLVIVSTSSSLLRICAHCGDCLKQIVADPYKLNVVLYYQNEKGDYVEWKPPTPKKG